MELAGTKARDAGTLRRETDRLIKSPGFDRFVGSFTDYWLDLRNIRRDEPDIVCIPSTADDYIDRWPGTRLSRR